MSLHRLSRKLRGPFNFLRPRGPEIERLIPDAERILPAPQKVFLDDETATPLEGYPILQSATLSGLAGALERYVEAEEVAEVERTRRAPFDARGLSSLWRDYSQSLAHALGKATRASHGRQFPEIFWLLHSQSTARVFKGSNRRILRIDLEIGRSQGELIKYRVFDRWLDRTLQVAYEVARRAADQIEGSENDQFPPLLRRMADNVLIFTQEHISQDLQEIAGYLKGHLQIDGRDLRRRLEALREWHGIELERHADLRALGTHILGVGDPPAPEDLLRIPGYLHYLAKRPGYDARRLLDPQAVDLWDQLLEKLQEFEIYLGLRRRILPVTEIEGRPSCRDPGLAWSGPGWTDLVLSTATRPLDFFHEWVVEPVVERFGMIYDLTSFTEVVSQLRRQGKEVQDRAFRSAFDLQRWIDRHARGHRLRLEKYLGDGALYSGRHPKRLLLVSVLIQRRYRQIVDEGFPFNRGMRVALNFGTYRLLPIGGSDITEAHRYEFLGHGIVELSRLVTGKATREIEEIKNLLVRRGYPEGTVDRFFAPLVQHKVELVDRDQLARRFFAYINRYGNLINEGIVATQDFIVQLERAGPVGELSRGVLGGRAYVVLQLREDGLSLRVGLRKLGLAAFKGLGKVPVVEIVDGDEWTDDDLLPLPGGRLSTLLEQQFHSPADREEQELPSA